jgi:hypothetical protein
MSKAMGVPDRFHLLEPLGSGDAADAIAFMEQAQARGVAAA